MITSVMYHYVRPVEDSQLRYLSVDDFKKQLDWFESSIGKILSRAEWEDAKAGKPQSGVLLTFDDGLKDHAKFVLPILIERGYFGIFFINTAPLVSKCVLPVHIAHKLLSLGISSEIFDFFQLKLPKSVLGKLDQGVVGTRYTKQIEQDINIKIKKIINYLFLDFNLSAFLDSLTKEFLRCSISELSSAWYLTREDVQRIDNAGMGVGSHSSTHRLLSKLNKSEIYTELAESKVLLEHLLGKSVNEFCYPYGGKNSYNQIVKENLSTLKYSVAHDVSPRKIYKIDFANKYELPRYDCNEFPFGKAYSLKN